MYATDGRTDKQTDKSNAYCPLLTGGGIIITRSVVAGFGRHGMPPPASIVTQVHHFIFRIKKRCIDDVSL